MEQDQEGQPNREEAAYEKDLLSNEKEKSEHIMLVDLETEDLERVCCTWNGGNGRVHGR